MKYIVKENYKDNTTYNRFTTDTIEKALDYIKAITGGITEIVNNRYYGKKANCGAVRTWYTIEVA